MVLILPFAGDASCICFIAPKSITVLGPEDELTFIFRLLYVALKSNMKEFSLEQVTRGEHLVSDHSLGKIRQIFWVRVADWGKLWVVK